MKKLKLELIVPDGFTHEDIGGILVTGINGKIFVNHEESLRGLPGFKLDVEYIHDDHPVFLFSKQPLK